MDQASIGDSDSHHGFNERHLSVRSLGDPVGSGQAPPLEDFLGPGFQRSGDDLHGRDAEGREVSQSIHYLSLYAWKKAF